MDGADIREPDRSLSGLHAVVSGAAGGIGSAIARQLIARGATVHGLDRDAQGLFRAAREFGGKSFVPITVDLADRAAVDRVLAEVLEALEGRCDILVNNAGVSRVRPLEDTDDVTLDWLFAVNFTAAFRITRTLLPALRASGRGTVVNIASEFAMVGQSGYSAYCATKGAILAWSRALAVELAGQRIRVNAVCPGPIDTSMLQEEFRTFDDAHAAQITELAAIPLSRLGKPDEIAAIVAFLASDAAAFVTGAAWSADGGKTAR